MERRRLGKMWIVVGCVALLIAVAISWNNHREGDAAVAASEHVLMQMESQQNSDSNAAVIENNEYMGSLFFPSLNLRVPVMTTISEAQLLIAPCCQKGSVAEGGLVIAGHNFVNQFGRLDRLCVNENVFLTDMRGEVMHYTVQEIELIAANDAARMLDSQWALTLYTCDYSGNRRLTLRCSRVET